MTRDRLPSDAGPRAAGFSLIEVLIVVVFIAGSLLALAKLQGSLISGSILSQQRTEATFLAQKLMEDLKSNAYDSASLAAGTYPQTAVTGRSTSFTPSYTVADVTSPPRKSITVTVSWTDANGQTQSTTLVTQYQASQAKASGNSLLIAESFTTSTGSSTSTSSTSTSSTSTSSTSSTSTSGSSTGSSTSSTSSGSGSSSNASSSNASSSNASSSNASSSNASSTSSTSTSSTSTSSTSSTSGSSTGSSTSSTSTSSSSGTPTTFSCSRLYKKSGGWTQPGYPTSSPTGNESCCTATKFQNAFSNPSNNVTYQLTGQTCP